jgi:hypothetical protein
LSWLTNFYFYFVRKFSRDSVWIVIEYVNITYLHNTIGMLDSHRFLLVQKLDMNVIKSNDSYNWYILHRFVDKGYCHPTMKVFQTIPCLVVVILLFFLTYTCSVDTYFLSIILTTFGLNLAKFDSSVWPMTVREVLNWLN